MRPISLTMQAFGSYGKKTTIDFTEPNQNLFLITGDTGAGKTTIFDAIVFALYGEASSIENVKDGTELQSQYADIDLEPSVELTFSELKGGEELVYIVQRVPRHIRSSKRRRINDQQEVKEEVLLTLPDGSQYPQNKKETDRKIEEIIGLTKAQFMQVGMIAQGEFMQLLRASSNDKKPIFRKLFQTDIYQDIIDELSSRQKEKSKDIARIRTECQTEIGHVDIPDFYENAENLQALKRRIITSARLNIADLESFRTELTSLCTVLKERNADLKQKTEDAKKERDRKRDAYNIAVQLQDMFRQMEAAEKAWKECEESQPEIDSAKILQHTINTAYDIQTVFQRYTDADRSVAEKKEGIRKQKKLLPELKAAAQKAEQEERESADTLEAAQSLYAKTTEKVEKARNVFDAIEKAWEEYQKKESHLSAMQELEHEARTKWDEIALQEIQYRKQAEDNADAAVLYEQWKSKKKEADDIQGAISTQEGLLKEIENQEIIISRTEKQYGEIRDRFTNINAEYAVKNTAYLDQQAGFIAKERLKKGEPCPVCGSLEHPRPCMLSDEHLEITRELIDQLAEETAAIRNEMDDKSSELGAARELLREKQKAFHQQQETLTIRARKILPGLSDFPGIISEKELSASVSGLSNLKEVLSGWINTLAEEKTKLIESVRLLTEAQESLKNIYEEKKLRKNTYEQAAKNLTDAREACVRSEEVLKNWEKQKEYASREEAEKELTAAVSGKEQSEDAYEKAKRNASDAKTVRERCRALITQFEGELPGLEQERKNREKDYKEILADKRMTQMQWQEIAAAHPKSEVQEIQNRIQKHTEKKANAEGALEIARKTIGNQQKPDLDEALRAKNEAEGQLEDAEKAFRVISEIWRTDKNIADTLAPKMEERSRIVAENNRISSMYDRLAGKVTGSRMDIETFVQRYHLERILYAANSRFQDMSAGQFELRMVDMEKAGDGRNRGLDLMVYSTVTGKEREIRTLSGGESFMAALSLALGMADQIQENTASINLDVMFIDEGFGSLDEHSRNQAVKVLQQMAGGSKLIGIISHVTELKQEIEDQLIVNKDDEGSHVRWQIS